MNIVSASSPAIDGKMPHIMCTKEDIGEIVLLPGDPGRVAMFENLLERFRIITSNREYTVGTGYYKDVKITVCSTGIGGSSTEIAVVQLIALGAKALIRIGGTGVLKEEIENGSMVINTGAVRMGGVSEFYVPLSYPAIASFEAVDCLKRACETRKLAYAMGIGVSVSSFYHGQGRSLPFESDYNEQEILDKYARWNVINMEMEAETLFTLSSVYNVLSGSICYVHCNRITNQWLVENEACQNEMCLTALDASWKLYHQYLHTK